MGLDYEETQLCRVWPCTARVLPTVEPARHSAVHSGQSPRGIGGRLRHSHVCGQVSPACPRSHGPDNVLRVARVFVTIKEVHRKVPRAA